MGDYHSKLFKIFEFDANANDVLEYILQSHDHRAKRTVKLGWIYPRSDATAIQAQEGELYLFAYVSSYALYSINVRISLWQYLEDKELEWRILDEPVGVIKLTQIKPNQCFVEFFLNEFSAASKTENQTSKDEKILLEYVAFVIREEIGFFWKELIEGWLSRNSPEIQEEKTERKPGRPGLEPEKRVKILAQVSEIEDLYDKEKAKDKKYTYQKAFKAVGWDQGNDSGQKWANFQYWRGQLRNYKKWERKKILDQIDKYIEANQQIEKSS